MSTHDLYRIPADYESWNLPATGEARFTWEYDDSRDRLLALYRKGKSKQWDADDRIDWSQEVDPENPVGLPLAIHALNGAEFFDKLPESEKLRSGAEASIWQFSQFLHGEQGALVCSARIVESVPDMDSKFYAATQVMDEARHVETYARFLAEKAGRAYPINDYLKALLDNTLTDSRWDFAYLGMQVLIEGLALAAFGVLRDITQNDLTRQLLAYVMADEARHVAFGRLALRDVYAELTSAEKKDREDFVIEGCYLMRNRFNAEEVWELMEYPMAECREAVEHSPYLQSFRALLFSRIVPCVKDIGLWSPRVQQTFADMGVLGMAGLDLDDLSAQDESKAEAEDARRRDEEHFAADYGVRIAEVDAAIAAGSEQA